MELDKTYNAKDHEEKIYKEWEEKGLFKPELNPDGKPWTISLPPPNATGTLHLGHATMLAIEDLMIRYHRMIGDAALWVPGTDHAAIATQSKVEAIIKAEEGKTRHDLGREEFLNRVKAFVAGSQDTIRNQIRKMGASVDWDRERYTFEDGLNRIVNEVFVKMYNDKLIYRGYRSVNWDPIGQTTVSDDEVDYKEEKAKFYTFKYGPFEIGTARPETKFGDKYVVIHPDDKRYKKYKDGQKIELEWINGPMTATVIKDEASDPEFGTGVMTITPWHSAIDFEIAQRHDLDKEQIIDKDGKLLPIAGEFAGMPIEEAREKIVEKLDKKGLLVSIDEDYKHNVAVSERFKGKIEPQIMEQWFVDVNKKAFEWAGKQASLKSMMQDMVRSGEVKIIPERFEKVYFDWVDNLRDWCISRQIWWGHQIPVWYKQESTEGQSTNDQRIHVGTQAPEGEGWDRDPDTLDTWFSSASWTWSTLIDRDLASDYSLSLEDLVSKSADMRFHPTQVLETGYDIIFFWVARMILMTGYAIGQKPFDTVYLHGLVRDKDGQKMSKSKGNGIDPIEVIDQYGADAVRLSLMIGTSPGNDSRLFDEKIAGYRNFVNKLWNIARYILMQVENPCLIHEATKGETISDKWILSRFQQLIKSTTDHIENFRFSPAGEDLFQFTWSELADWYVEDSKSQGNKDEILLYILTNLLKLWHPFMPYVSEVLYKQIDPNADLITADWPTSAEPGENTETIQHLYSKYQLLLTGIRNARADYKLAWSEPIELVRSDTDDDPFNDLIMTRAKVSKIYDTIPEGKKVVLAYVDGRERVYVIADDSLDTEKEKTRLEKELSEIDKHISSFEMKLSNKQFVENAPKEVVDQQKETLQNNRQKAEFLREQIQLFA